ncbi:MAG: hypothetical protein M3Z29_03790 [Pseudomonadota bacterium]|nr:hypothetical protein [Pseudomonadota bacterium]
MTVRIRLAAPLFVVAALASACASQSNLATATGDTRPQPVVVQVPVQVTSTALESGCWVQFYDERDFKGAMMTLDGPASLESEDKLTGRKLKRHIDSLVTGSKATLRIYEHAMFKDRSVSFGPNSREAGLLTRLGFGGEIQSMQLECSN